MRLRTYTTAAKIRSVRVCPFSRDNKRLKPYSASYNERLLLGNGLCVSPLQTQQGIQTPRSLRDVVVQIDNATDLKTYVASFAPKVGNAADIKYERHPVSFPVLERPWRCA